MVNKMKWNEVIKNLREDNDLTLKELAFKIGVDPKTLSRYEKGKFEPTISVLIKLSEIFNVSVDYLCGKKAIEINNDVELKHELNKIMDKLSDVVKSI